MHIGELEKEAYLVLGFTKKALKDTDTSITEEAKSFFELNLNYSKKS